MNETVLTFFSDCSSVDPSEMVLVEASGREAMSSLYEYELTLEVTRDGGLPAEAIDELLVKPCALIMTGTFSVEVHGVLRRLRMLGANESSPVLYQATLVPRFWNTTRTLRTMVYQDVTVQELIDQVLAWSGLEAEWALSLDYPGSSWPDGGKFEYIVQYEETDFAFISRVLEHWGLYYYFRQEPDGEQLVIADNNLFFATLDGYEALTFSPRSGRSGVAGTVQSIEAIHEPGPAMVVLRDYNWQTPSTQLVSESPVDERSGVGLHWHYGDHFKTPDVGATLARIRSEQLKNLRERYLGICSVPGLAPGHVFELQGCPVPDLNVRYLVTSVEPRIGVTGDQGDEVYQYPFTAVPHERDEPQVVPYRSQRVTPKPKILGFMNGTIGGEVAGTAAPIDDKGRYKVMLPMDFALSSGATEPGRASRWIRMAQASSGAYYGVHFPLHVGTEVAVIHMDGDPDRPVIMGSVPNTETMSPIVQGEATKSRIRTRTGIVVEFDDDVV